MAKEDRKEEAQKVELFAAHEPQYDQFGALRLDRPFSAAEARQLDEERAAEYERQRRGRFERFGPARSKAAA